MATADDVRRFALSLPETDEHPSYQGRPSFRVRGKSFARLLDDGVSCGVWLECIEDRDALLRSDADKFFITSHHDKYPTVLVRYAAVDADELRELIIDSWRVKAPKRVVAAFEAQESSKEGTHAAGSR
jgi:hypothetical protein